MNKKLNLVEILKDCPKGTKLYSSILGDVVLDNILTGEIYPIIVSVIDGCEDSFTEDGRLLRGYDGECVLFPSRAQRNWAEFTAPWFKKERFDPKTLKPFDKVLVKCNESSKWGSHFFSYIDNTNTNYKYRCIHGSYIYCIPYNEDTKHLVGTSEEAPEFYRYWED